MRIEARLAAESDLSILCQIADLAMEEKLEQRGGAIWSISEAPADPIEMALQRLFDDQGSLLVLGTIDGVVTGFATVTLQQPHDGAKPIADLQTLFVEPEARGVGVGEALMSVVVDWAKANHCRGIDSIALPGDRPTKNFFESFGLVARAIKVYKAL